MNETAGRIRAIVNLSLSPQLKELGFQNNGTQFYKFDGDSIQVVAVQSSRWNLSPTGRFRVNFGIHFPAVAEVLLGTDPMPKIPKEEYCILRGIFSVPDLWWAVDPSTDIERTAEKLTAYWRDDVWPWLAKNKFLSEAAQTLERQLAGAWAAAAARLVLGERGDAERLVKKYIGGVESSEEANSAANTERTKAHLRQIRTWAAKHRLKI